MAKKPKRVFKRSDEESEKGGQVHYSQSEPATVKSSAQVYKDGFNKDRLSITQQVLEYPEAHRVRTRDAERSKYDELLHSIYDAVIITDLDGSIFEVNARAEQVFMWSNEELCKKNIVDMISGADEKLLKMLRKNVVDNSKYAIVEAVCVCNDGSRFNAEIVINRLRRQEQSGLYFFIRDATERKQAEKELKKANAKPVEA